MSLSRVLSAGFAVLALGCALPAAHAQTKAFNDTFTGASTINANPTSPAAPSVTGASYQQIAAKVYNPKPPTITPGNLRFGIVSTSSGFNHVQALFTPYPVKLVNVGDYIELTVNFSTEGGILTAQANSTLFFGLFNANQIQPIPGGIENSTAAVAGHAQTWQGYVNRIFYAGGSNGFYTRPAQSDSTTNNQDLLFQYSGATTVGSTAVSSLATPVTGDSYTEVFRITKASATTLTLSSSLYAGSTASGAPIYTQTSTSGSTLTDTFDAFAFGWRATGSVASVMNVSSVKIVTTGTTTIIPEILTQPVSLTKMVGENVSLAVVADGGPGTALTYQWRKNGGDIPGATSSTYDITSVSLGDAGDYTVVVANLAGATTSDVATLTVTAGAVPPAIVTPPTGATILVGGSHTFELTANGTAPLTFRWEKSTDDGSTYTEISGATDTSHSITNAQLADAGLYRAVVTNAQGSATSTAASLIVQQAPAITTQPAGAALDPGSSHTLSVVATGAPAPTYQWRRNGLAIAGASSSSYTISSATGADAGNYTVVATNAVGSTTSVVASVVVRSTTMAATSLTPTTAATGLNRDVQLSLSFNEPVFPGVSGVLRLHDAADGTVVDTIDLVAATGLRDTLRASSALSTQLLPVQKKPIGGIPNDFNYYPITVAGNTATIHPRNGVLAYGKTYYVTVDAGVFVNATGESFAGIDDSSTWRFSTKADGPAAGTTRLTVASDGAGDFNTLQAALDFVPAGSTTPMTIFVKAGTYFEIVGFQQKHNVTILGEDAATTVLTYPNNNTFNNVSGVYHRSVMVAQSVRDFALVNLTIHNTTPQNGSQAEAIVINGPSASASRNVVTRCRFYSYQDTVQFNKQTYVSDSIIHGDVDFMWGDGPAYFENCDIRILRSGAYFTQIRNGSGNHGYVFRNCRFTAPAGITGTFFGRIDPTSFPHSEVVILDSVFGDAANNAFLSTDTGVSGAHYRAGWWLLNNVSSAAAAPNVHNWVNTIVDANGVPIANPNADAFTTMPADAATQANYRDSVWVLNTNMAGVMNGSWTPALAPIIVGQPAGVTLNSGEPLTLSVDAIAIPAAAYQWRKGGVDIPGATSASYTIGATAVGDAGDYTVVVSNTSGSAASEAATVVVIAGGPVEIDVVNDAFNDTDRIGGTDGSTSTSSAPSVAEPSATNTQWVANRAKQLVASSSGMQWTFDTTSSVMAMGYFPTVTVGSAPVTLTLNFTTGSAGVTANNLRFALIDDTPAGRRATDGFGSTDAAYVGDVGYAWFSSGSTVGAANTTNLGLGTYKRVTTSSNNLLGTSGEWGSALASSSGTTGHFEPNTAYTLKLVLSHDGSALSIQTSITGGNFQNFQYTATDASSPVLSFNTLALRFGGGSNQYSGINLTGLRVTTTGPAAGIVPTITTQPSSQTVPEGANVTFSTAATGTPTPTYQWFKNGNTLSDGGRVAGATTATLTLTGVLPADAAGYTVVASNSAGSDTSDTAALTVIAAAPSILTQPTSKTVGVGSTVSFTVAASGTAPLSYQWFKNGAPIDGAAAATFALTNVDFGDSGSYHVVVSNAAGSTPSAAATLTVTTLAQGSARYNLSGFGAAATGGGVIPETDAAYRQVSTPLEFVTAIRDANKTAGAVKVIEIMSDLGLGWNEVGTEVQSLASNPLRTHAAPKLHPVLLATGVSILDIKPKSGLTIFSAHGATIRHCNFNIKDTSNIIVRNLKFDELWEWDEATKGNYDSNDWDFITISNGGEVSDVWIDHCTFTKAYDGVADLKKGARNVTFSWCRYIGDDGATNPNSFVRQQLAALEANRAAYPMYNFLRTNGFSIDDIFAVLQGQDKGHLMGANSLDSANATLSATFHHQWFENVWDRCVPRLRGGNVHNYNILVDDSRVLAARRLRDARADALSSALRNTLNNTYNFRPPVNGSISTEGGAILLEKSIYIDCLWPLRNNQTDPSNPAYTGKILALDTVYQFLNTDGTTTLVRGNSTDPGSPLGPFQATVIPFSWNLPGNTLPYSYTLDDPDSLPTLLAAGAGAGTVVWEKGNWLRTAYEPGAPSGAPVITTHPVSQTVAVGANVSFSVVAAGAAPLAYQWQKNNTDLVGATGDTLQLGPIATSDAGNYRVIVSNSAGSTPSNVAVLTVQGGPTIVTHPVSQSLIVGASLSLTVAASGAEPLSYQWHKDGQPIAGATSSAYSIASVTLADAGAYTVVVSNAVDSVTSNAATIAIQSAPSGQVLVDDAFNDTDRIGGTDGSTTSSSSPSVSTPTATNTQWIVNRARQLVASSTGMQWTLDTTSSVMAIGYFPTANVGAAPVTLKLDFTTGSFGGSANNLRIALFDDTGGGRRMTDGFGSTDAAYVGDVGYAIFSTASNVGGGNTTPLGLGTFKRHTTTSNNLLGTASDWGTALGSSSAATGYLEANTAYTLELTLTFNGSALSVLTRLTGGNLNGLEYTVTDDDPVLSFNALALRFGTGSNQFSGIKLTGFRVTAGTGNDAPLITTPPASQTVIEGGEVSFTVVASGTPAPTYQWFKDGLPLTTGGRISGATSDTLTITGAAMTDAGNYTVEATNSAGSDVSPAATLTVTSAAPHIVAQPSSQTVNAGTAVAFSVGVTGATPLSYQWYKGVDPIPGATAATYTIASTAPSDAGAYRVVVSNAYGIAASDPATLTVNTSGAGNVVVDDTLADGDSQNQNLAAGSMRIFNGRTAHTRTDAPGSVSFALTTTGADAAWAYFTEAGSPLALAVGERLTVDVTFSVNGFVGTGQDIRFGVLNSAGTRNAANLTGGMNNSVFADDLAYGVRYVASGSSSPFTLLKRNPVGATANPNNPFNSAGTTDWSVIDTNAVGTSEVASLVNGVSYTLTYEIYRATATSTLLTAFVSGGGLPENYGRAAVDTDTTLTSFDSFGFRVAGSTFASSITFTRFTVAVERSVPEIIAQPVFANGQRTQSLPVGGTTILSVTVNGSELAYQWHHNGQPIPAATAATLDLFNVQLTDAGDYTVTITNPVGSATSDPATLTVTGGDIAPTIVTAPASQLAAEGSSASFFVDAIGTTPFSYQWFKDGLPIAGATAATYPIAHVTFDDAADYTVTVSNVVGHATSAPATLTVRGIASIEKTGFAADVTGGAAGATVIVSTRAELLAYAEDLTTPYTIVVNGTIDLGPSGRVRLRSNKTLRGATTSSTILGTINISNATNVIVSNLNISADTGEPSTNDGVTIASSTRVLVTKCTIYNCTDGNLDVINGSDLVTVSWCKFYYTRNNGHNFSNLVGSSDTDVGTGDGRTNYRVTWHHNWWAEGGKQRMIACRFGQAHMFNNYWSCVGNDYATESRNVASLFSEHNYYHGVNHPLAKRTALPTDVGLLMTIGNVFDNCVGRQEQGSDELFTPPYSYGLYATASVPAIVMAGAGNVTDPSPAFATAAISGPTSPATVGGSVTLTTLPSGFTPVSYQWRRNNVVIAGATSAALELTGVQAPHAGNYTVVIGLPDGNAVVSAPFALSVADPINPPTIVTSPAGQTATVGDTVSFNVVASSGAPLAYQWRKDGNELAGATAATLELTNITTANAGNYHCVVSNAGGSVTSAVATLIVQKATVTVVVTSGSTTFDGSPKTPVITTTPADLPVAITYNGSASAPANAGSYAVSATVVHADYTGSGSGTLVILPASAAVSLTNLSHTYDGSPKAASAVTTPAGLPVDLTYDGSASAPSDAGSYPVAAAVTDPNYTGSVSGTLTIAKAIATIGLAPLTQHYDGAPKPVVATSSVPNLEVKVTYDGAEAAPTYPGPHVVVATIEDRNYEGSATDTLLITISAIARRVAPINGELDGSLQVLLPAAVTLNGSAMISGDLLVPGTPTLRINGKPAFGGMVDGPGAANPSNHTVTLGGGTVLRQLVRRIDASDLPLVVAPPVPAGTRDVVLSNSRQSIGNLATLRNLTLNGGAGQVAVPPGTYGSFVANGGSGFVLGVAGTTSPTIYNLQTLTLNGASTLQVVGPVILTLANGTIINGTAGHAMKPEWLVLRVASGGVTLNTGAKLRAWVTAPAGAVTLGDSAILLGRVAADSLTLNSNALFDDPAP
jgi:pectate lyase